MTCPFFSIIIPIYNSALYLKDCLSSIFSQTFTDYEIIIVDDGSTDGSLNICKSYALSDNRISVITQKNSGVSVARNTGVQHSSGRYLLFIDSDDFIGKERLQCLYEKTEKSSIDIVITDFFTVSKEMPILNKFSSDNIKEDFIAGNWAVVWRLCIRKDKLIEKQITFNENLQYGEDYLFSCFLLLNMEKIAYVPTNINTAYFYRKNNTSSLMHNHGLKQIEQQCCATEMIEEYLLSANTEYTKLLAYLNIRKNWCRTLLFDQACYYFNMGKKRELGFLRKIFRFLFRFYFKETKEAEKK